MFPNRTTGTSAGDRAFSLIEVVVALTIFSAGIVGVMGTFSLCTRAAGANLRLAEAVALAQRQMELSVATPPDQLAGRSGTENRFNWGLTVEQMPQGLLRASVAIDWLERGQRKNYRLSQILLPRRPVD